MHRHSSIARWSLPRLFTVAAIFLVAGVADAQAQIVFRETFGTVDAQLPTATSTADGNWTSATCLNGLITGPGGAPTDTSGATHFLLNFTHGPETGFPACTYAASQAVWRLATAIPVQPNTTYVFSYWSSLPNIVSKPVLTQVVTPNAGAIVVHSITTPDWPSAGPWVQRTVTFTTGATTTAVDLQINNANTTGDGNDFGLDDISLSALAPACNVAANGSFEAPNIQGLPDSTYANGWAVYRTGTAALDGWNVLSGTIDHLRYFNNASDGDQSIDLWGTQPATIQQTFTGLTPGVTYSFAIDYSGLTVDPLASVYLDQGAGFQLIQTLTPAAAGVNNGNGGLPGTRSFTVTWANFAHSFVATGTQATIRFVNRVAPGAFNTGLFIDNFQFGGQAPCEDFGDAPASYATLAANNGPRHAVAGPYLGAGLPDIDLNGTPNSVANGDDATGGDEDGVIVPVFERGAAATINVQVGSASSGTVLQGWVDWDGDGSFAQAGDHVIVNQPVVNGPNTFNVTAPAATTFGTTFARFRIADVPALTHEGAAASGEVEDYQVTIDAEPPGGVFPTCPISQEPPATNFTIKQRWTTQDVAGRRTLPYQTPVVGDLFGTGQIVAVVPADNGFNWNTTPNGPWAKDLHIFRGSDGAWLRTITTPHFNWFGHTAVAIADVDGDGQGEILMKASHNVIVPAAYRGRLVAYRNDGTELWVSNIRYDYNNDEANTNKNRRSGHALSIADFNGDGIPEVFIGNQVFNARTGVRLAARPATDSAGCVVDCIQGATVAVDMDDDGLLELVAGNVVYKVTITNPGGTAGNSITPWQTAQAVPGMGDGWTAVADIDLDGDPDVVVIQAPADYPNVVSRLFVWDGQTATVLGAFNLGLNALGGEPLIGDIDGDGGPEIVFVTVGQLNAFDFVPGNPPATALVKKWGVATNDASGMTSFALFDFNSDGNKELVYRDEQNVRIMDGSGSTAVDRATFACTSGTRAEMPVIAALDGTGEARILVTCGTAANPQFQGVLRAFETASFPWAQTRPVWNQQTYFVSHIENDLTVPSEQFPHWTSFSDPGQVCSTGVNRPLNAFQQQVTDLDRSTGCPVSCPLPANVSVGKTASSDLATAGGTVTYTVVATNTGPGNGPGTVVQDPFPAGIVSATWTCAAAGGAACPNPNSGGPVLPPFMVNETVTTLPPNGTLTYSITATVDSNPPDEITNTASVSGPLVLCLPDGTEPPCDSPPSIVRRATADLTISKVSTPNPYVPGEPLTYAIVVSNLGPNDAPGAVVQDTFPALTGVTWSCTASGGATCSATGTGAINDTVNLPAGASLTYTATGMVPSSLTGPLTNTATVTPVAGMLDPVPGNNTAQDVNNAQITADLRSSKSGTPSPFVPGETLTYTVIVSNAGPSDVTGAPVQDALPAAFVSAGFTWTCTPATGANCQTASGTGNINVLVDLDAGTSATFTIAGTVPSGFTSAADNSATVTPPPDTHDPTPGNNTSTYNNPPDLIADLAITKTQSPDPYLAGGTLTYTLLVTNLGPSDVANARVQDLVPGVMTGVSWACAAGAGASCASPGGLHFVDALVTLPVGTTATFTIAGTVASSTTGVLTNTATVTAPSNVTDRNPGNNEATVNTAGAPQADLAAVKTASPDPYTPGAPLTYTIVVSNNGPSDALNARVQDLFPAGLSGFTWTCAPSSGAATCGVASGQSLIDVFVDLPAGSAVTFTATGTVPANMTGELTNTATVTPPPGVTDPTPTNNSSTSALGARAVADLSLTKTSAPNPYVPGMPITYTIVASNAGPSTLLGGRVQDGLPAVLQNPTWTCVATDATCPAPSGTGNLDALVDIEPGGTVTFEITADVPAGTNGSLVNAAIIVPPPGTVDTVPNNNTGTNFNPSIPPAGPVDLQITQEFPSVAPPNGLLTFTLRTRNLGGYDALNPYVTGMIPPGTTLVSVNPGPGGIANTPGNPPAPDPVTGYPIPGAATEPLRVTWPGLMKPGESHVMEFTVRVAPGTPTGQILWSCFWTWPENEDAYHANNVVDAYLFVHDGTSPVGDLSVQAAAAVVSGTGASADQSALETYEAIGTELPVRVGGTVKMRFWSTNAGPAATRGQYALILDEVAISVVDVTLPQGWVSPSGPSSAVWDTGVIQPGQTVNLDLTVRLNTTGAIKLFAQRITGSPGDPNASNEHAEIVLDGYGPNATGRWVAVGNVDGAGQGEILTSTGQGETPQVRVFTGTGADTGVRFFAYERPFLGGVRIASCDVNGDGIDELITAPGPGRAPTIRVLSLVGGVVTELTAFDTFEASFTGGASIACADLDGDGSAELVVGAGPGRAPEVQVYNVGLSSVALRATFLAYESGFLGGVRVAAGVYPGRAGWLEPFAIATAPGTGRPAELRLWTPTGGPVAQVVVSSATKGVLPTLGDVNGDGQLDLLLAPDDGRPELVRIFSVDTGDVLGDVPGGLPAFPVGIRTAVGVLEGGPGQPEIVIGNGPGGHPRVRVIYWPPAGPVQRLEILPLEIP